MLPGFAAGNCVALRLNGHPRPIAARFDDCTEPHYPLFAYLLKAIERMVTRAGRVILSSGRCSPAASSTGHSRHSPTGRAGSKRRDWRSDTSL
jgi:hypothetical protein